MGCKTETKTIGEREYSVRQWPAEKAILMKFKLAKAFGASLATLLGNEGAEELDTISKSFALIFDNSSPEELVALMKSCIVNVACDGTKITETSFNELFSGDNLLEIYQVFIFVLQVNYSNLFQGQLADRYLAKLKENL